MSTRCPVFCQVCMLNDTHSCQRCYVCTRVMCTQCAVGMFMCIDCHLSIAKQGTMTGCRWCTVSSFNLERCVECRYDVCEVCREFCDVCMRYYCAHHECVHSE